MKKVKALFDFWGESAAELSFQAGEILTVIKQDDPGWWEGELNGRKGLFPSNYVEPVKDAEVLTANPALAARPIAAVNTRPPSQPLPTAHAAARSPPPHQVASRALPPPVHQTHAIPENKPSTFSPPPGSVSASVISSTPAAAAASSSGGERKPAGQVVGGGGTEESKKLLVSKTKIGLWSSNIAFYSGLTMIPLGLLAVLWHLVDGDRWSVQTLLSGIYSVVIGIGIMFYETYYGQTRGPSRFPLRAIVYIGLSVYLFFALATLLGGLFLILAGVTNFIACVLLKEVYDAPPPRVHAKVASDLPPASSFCEGLSAWASAARQQNKKGVVVFMLIYVLGNLGLFAWTVNHWALKNESLPPGSRLSDYGPWAKGFGSLLDLNCAIIVLPVSRTLLRLLYNRSTADQGFLSRTLRAVLEYVPLDQNITFHKIIAWVILIAACGHIGLHFANLAFAYTNTVAIFGGSAWFTGGMICVWMMLIYSATPENTRRGQFEVFWYSHHCFVLFFIFILFHGKGGINPHYWMYAIPTMTIYVIERLLRVYRASLPVSILSISLMDDVMSLEFAKEGFFETESYKEGQYLFLLSPPISRVQWHPFTISSAPQEASVTVHIRVMGEGSWTRGLMQYLSTMGPKGRSFIPLDRMGPSGKVPGKICGPDGRALLQIDGPHSAPTQHIGEYSTVIVVGAGIGATPVSSTLKSIVHHTWRLNIGQCFPASAYFVWVCAYRDVDAFRWLIRTIKEACDEVTHMRANGASMAGKNFAVHIFLTSAPKNAKPVNVVVDDEIGFWGPPREASKLDKVRANWDEIDLYKVLKCPAAHTQLGDVHVWSGRPNWNDRFAAVSAAHPSNTVGVTFCGNPLIAKDLRKQCFLTNKNRADNAHFKLHKENF